jgi:hypothetical protein
LRACSRLRSRFCLARSSWVRAARRALRAALSQAEADDTEVSGAGMGLQAVTQFWEVRALMWAVEVSTGLLASDGRATTDAGLGPVPGLTRLPPWAFWIRLDTAAEATSLKSASDLARRTPVADTCAGGAAAAGFLRIICPAAVAAEAVAALASPGARDMMPRAATPEDGTAAGLAATWWLIPPPTGILDLGTIVVLGGTPPATAFLGKVGMAAGGRRPAAAAIPVAAAGAVGLT